MYKYKPALLKKNAWAIPTILFIISFTVRLYRINTPPIDVHAWRQAITVAVAKNYILEDANILRPRQNELLPADNYERYMFLEFPIYQYSVALLYKLFGFQNWIPRLVTIFISSVTSIFIYLITLHIFKSKFAGFMSGMLFTLFPVSYFFGRATIPDMTGLMFFTLYVLLLISNRQTKRKSVYTLSSLSLAISIIIKPYYLIYSPLLLMELYALRKIFYNNIKILFRYIAIYGLIMIAPYVLWVSYYTYFFPEALPKAHMYSIIGAPSSGYLLYIRSMLMERFSYTLFTFTGFTLSLIGCVLYFTNLKWGTCINQFRRFMGAWGVLGIMYLLIVTDGNLQHQYYQLPFVPLICIFTTLSLLYITDSIRFYIHSHRWGRLFGILLLCGLGAATYLYQSYQIFSVWYASDVPYYPELPSITKIISPGDRVVTTGYYRNPTFLDLTHRQGWPINSELVESGDCPYEYRTVFRENVSEDTGLMYSLHCYMYPFIKEKKEQGAKYFVVIKKEMPNSYSDLLHLLPSRYIYQSDEVTIYKIDSIVPS